MNYFSRHDLFSSREQIGNLVELNFNDDSSAIISEYGGRLLGFYPNNKNFSLLWINPEIQNVIKSGGWEIGGDRYWISPEREFFYEKPDSWEGWFCPHGLDPAYYEILAESTKSCTLSSPITIESQIKKEIYHGEVTRQISLIKEPIATGLSYIGVQFVDDCVFFQPNLQMNGWSLACVISGGLSNPGTALIPTKSNPKPLSYFRTIPQDRLHVGENYVAFKIDVDDVYKLAIRPEDIDFSKRAKIGYTLKMPDSEEYGFLVKISEDIPQSQKDCFDLSRDHPDEGIGVIQTYNSESVDKSLLKFGEIELQLSQFKTVDNTSHSKAIHQIFGYIGSKEEILYVIEKMLGISDPHFYF
ncbi:MAG: hypothetical protein EAX91_17650 [Candidatus Lokiarchaeota archaeon]|nr:hypothetical protein [Candidatus Lokiarchaeota archaeon]